MSQFDERKKAFEKKFQQDEARGFKIAARAAKALGAWAAEQMGLAGAVADAYVASVLDLALATPGHDGLLGRIAADFAAKGVALSERQIANRYHTILADIDAFMKAQDDELAVKSDGA